jgi:muramoyltetrapeptide carboxypeptidase
MPIKPNRLCHGDTIGLIAPASAPKDPDSIDRAVAALEILGFKIKLSRHVRKRWGFLAGWDQNRASDLMKMFTDQAVSAIVCLRGGYGSARVLRQIDYQAIRRQRKILVGYSDITSLHCAMLRQANLISFHGPMPVSDFLKPDFPKFALKSFLRTLMQPTPPGSICQGYHKKTVKIIRGGKASGRLVGGNLSILCASLGTPFQPSFRNALLFFEEVDEVPYRLDRMLTHLLNAGLLQQVCGIAIGINKNCRDPNAMKTTEYRQTVEDVFRERLLPLRIPIVSGLPFGHTPFNATLPIGAQATLDTDIGDLVITEAAVK